MQWTDLSDFHIKSALHEESHDGTVWVSGPKWKRGHPLVLRNKAGKTRRARVLCRVIDPAFIAYYNAAMRSRYGRKRARALDPEENYIFISRHYRDQLGLPANIQAFDGTMAPGLAAKHPNPFVAAGTRWRALISHADPVVRISTWLATISMLLAAVALVPVFVTIPRFG